MGNNMRYPGPKPFAASQSHLFYGREKESLRLLRLLQNRQLTVLYGRSGYGKSSLLNAAVLPQMQEDGYHVINVRLGAWTPESTNTPLRSTVQAIADKSEHLKATILDKLVQWDNSLWYYAKTYSINSKRPKLLFVFDQFEELFTYPIQERELYENDLAELLKTSLPQRYRNQLKQQILKDDPQRAAVFDQLEIKVVIAIRSNRFHLLERLSTALPEILQNTLELDALEREGARSAIVGPAKEEGDYATQTFTYSSEVQEQILNFLTQEGKIEGILLQMLCSHFERLIANNEGKRSITEGDLLLSSESGEPVISGLEQIVDYYYRDRIDDLPDDQEDTVKRFIEDNLVQKVGNGGMRLSMHQAQIKERFKIEADILDTLVENGLLRTEPFMRGGVTYELTHDRLITPVLKSKAYYDAGEADRLKKQLDEEARKRREAEVLQAKAEAAKAEAEAERQKALDAKAEAEAERSRALAAEAEAVQGRRRARLFSIASFVTLLLATGSGLWAMKSLREARSAQAAKNLNECKQYLIDARQLAKYNYCDSAKEKMLQADNLIQEYLDLDIDQFDVQYQKEAENLTEVRQSVEKCEESNESN